MSSSARSSSVAAQAADRAAPAPRSGDGPAWGRALAWIALVAVLAWAVKLVVEGSLDLMVYNMGAQWVAHPATRAQPLYDLEFPVPWGGPDTLPFTYPPFAALLFGLLAWIPFDLTRFLLLALDIIGAIMLGRGLLAVAERRGRPLPWTRALGSSASLALITALILFCGPWIRTISLGQVNILLFALIFLDLVRRTDGTGSRLENAVAFIPRGVLIGIAAGIKLTPLAFGLIFLMGKNFKAILAMGVTFAATVGLGFLVLYQDSIQFWTDAVSSSDRVGSIKYIDNTALTGVLIKTGVPANAVDPIRYVLVLIMLIAVAVALPLLLRRGMTLSAISMNALVMLFMSPISWSHHQVYYPVIAVALFTEAFPHVLRGGFRLPAQIMAWIWLVGAYIGPMRGLWIVDLFGVHLHAAETIWVIPYLVLFVLLLTWSAAVVVAARRDRRAGSGTPAPAA
ncbi:glycosyltransferase 87 family protein [Kocuria palustris]|uniref:glycosyltransferase 87 family protein n=1 Tax=Kocuria palustris TaxID=71999 RepID=UPI0006AA4496|nr:glycosyltransferase 87 family protein [Kocuria palustris]MCT1834125.1 glycosyltransferase 87 family protein [Kocuria palustris]